MVLQPNSYVSQQLALPLFTLRAVCPYFSFTASFMSVPAIPLLLLADLNDILRFQSLIARAALCIQELQQFLEGLGICCLWSESELRLSMFTISLISLVVYTVE